MPDVGVDPAEFDARKAGFERPPPRYTTGVLAKYTKLVGLGSQPRSLRLGRPAGITRPVLSCLTSARNRVHAFRNTRRTRRTR
jgi:hypothetical protein